MVGAKVNTVRQLHEETAQESEEGDTDGGRGMRMERSSSGVATVKTRGSAPRLGSTLALLG